ncbi:MAG: 50S ribosomal protein L31e [bacterium]|nr:50S ribosomal protein L31e [bacterium]
MADLERIYVIPLRAAYNTSPRTKRSRKAVKIVRGFICRHMKAEEADVAISEGVNSLIWKRGIQKPPRKIKVRAVKSGDRVVVSLLDEKVEEKKLETPKPKKEEAKPEEKKAEAAPVKEEPKKEEKPPEPKAEEKKEPEKPAEAPKPVEKVEAPKPEVKAEAPEKKE